jgi:hypothetical protein
MPPTRKRKTDEGTQPEETPKKRTKKEARELALKRAKEAMEADKLKVEKVKAKKHQTAASDKEDDGKIGSTPAKRHKTADKKLASAKKPEATASKSAAAAKSSIKSPAAKKSKSKEALKATEALKPVETPILPTQAPAPVAQQQQPQFQGMGSPQMNGMNPSMHPAMNAAAMGYGQMNNFALPPGAPVNTQGVSEAMMAQYMMGQQQRMMGGPYVNMGQQPYGGGFGGQFAAQYAPMNNLTMQQQQQQQQQAVQQQMQVKDATAKQANPVVQQDQPTQKLEPSVVPPTGDRTISSSSSAKKSATAIPESDDDDDDMPPPPSATLEMQISQQVMANVAALQNNEPTPFNVPPPEAFTQVSSSQLEDDAEEEVYDDQPIIVDDYEIPPLVKKRRNWGRGLVCAIVVAILSYIIMMDGDGPAESPAKLHSSDADCYFDSIAGDSEDYVPSCSNEPGAPCPEGSVCKDGEIVTCQYWFEEVSNDGKSCGLPATSLKTLETIMGVLEEKSIANECSLFSLQSRPLFNYADVQFARPMELATNPLELAILEKELVSERKDGKFFIGLPDDHFLELPFLCRATASVKSFVGGIGSLMVLLLHITLSWIWSTCTAYPIASLVGLIVVLLVRKRRQYQAHRSKLVRDIAHVRQMSYELLQDSPSSSHVVLHIRDEIAMTMYPDSKSQRQYMIKEVWPRIIPDFMQDNRVRKSSRVIEGKPRDVWQWVAATSAKKPAAATTLSGQ